MEKFEKILHETDRTYSKIMSDLHNKIDSKFEASEKRIEDIPPCEAMPVDTGRADLQRKQQKLRQRVLNLKDKSEIYVNLMQTRMEQLKAEYSKISAEIITVQQVGIDPDLEEELRGLKKSKAAVVKLHREAIRHMQGESGRLDRELKFLKNEIEHLASLSAARKSSFSDNLELFEEGLIRLNNKKCILEKRISEIEERRDTVVDNARQKVTEMEMEIEAMTAESENVKNELGEELKALDICKQESENLSRRIISPSPCQQDM